MICVDRLRLRVPGLEEKNGTQVIRTESVAFDGRRHRWLGSVRSVLDYPLLRSFPERLKQILPAGLGAPLVDKLWRMRFRLRKEQGCLD